MLFGVKKGGKPSPAKVADKDLHCYECGGIIPKGSQYKRQDCVKVHYTKCPLQKQYEPN